MCTAMEHGTIHGRRKNVYQIHLILTSNWIFQFGSHFFCFFSRLRCALNVQFLPSELLDCSIITWALYLLAISVDETSLIMNFEIKLGWFVKKVKNFYNWIVFYFFHFARLSTFFDFSNGGFAFFAHFLSFRCSFIQCLPHLDTERTEHFLREMGTWAMVSCITVTSLPLPDSNWKSVCVCVHFRKFKLTPKWYGLMINLCNEDIERSISR